jgi:hypothetical protein
MSRARIEHDPTRAYQRRRIAARRVGVDAQCACGEKRPEALIAGTKPITCTACQNKKEEKMTNEKHHIAGKANSPTTISVPVNDHRARLSTDQYDWPRETLQNPDQSPLLRAAACIRGFVDTVRYLMEDFLLWIAELLEKVDAFLRAELGRKWWLQTNIEDVVPEGWSNDNA